MTFSSLFTPGIKIIIHTQRDFAHDNLQHQALQGNTAQTSLDSGPVQDFVVAYSLTDDYARKVYWDLGEKWWVVNVF